MRDIDYFRVLFIGIFVQICQLKIEFFECFALVRDIVRSASLPLWIQTRLCDKRTRIHIYFIRRIFYYIKYANIEICQENLSLRKTNVTFDVSSVSCRSKNHPSNNFSTSKTHIYAFELIWSLRKLHNKLIILIVIH